jgi:hypothetical protein
MDVPIASSVILNVYHYFVRMYVYIYLFKCPSKNPDCPSVRTQQTPMRSCGKKVGYKMIIVPW